MRYACMMLFALALLNAPFYSPAEIAAQRAYNNRWYGGGMKATAAISFPAWTKCRPAFSRIRCSGPYLKNNLSVLLINTVAGPTGRPAKARPSSPSSDRARLSHGRFSFPRHARANPRRQRHRGCHRLVSAAETRRRELHRALPVSQGKVAELQRQSAQANLPLLRLPQRRRRVHLRQGIRKHRLHGRRAPAGRARENSAGI